MSVSVNKFYFSLSIIFFKCIIFLGKNVFIMQKIVWFEEKKPFCNICEEIFRFMSTCIFVSFTSHEYDQKKKKKSYS